MTITRNWMKRLYRQRVFRAVTPSVSAPNHEVHLTLLDEYDYRKLDLHMSPAEARRLAASLIDYASSAERNAQ